jgi:hypothetical protein
VPDNDNNGGEWTLHVTVAGEATLEIMLPGGNILVLPATEGWVHQFDAVFFHQVVALRQGVRVYLSAYTKDFLHASALGALRAA